MISENALEKGGIRMDSALFLFIFLFLWDVKIMRNTRILS